MNPTSPGTPAAPTAPAPPTPETIALKNVAAIAAYCCIDLDANLAAAQKEYMDGEIANGAFQHVLNRHTMMHMALQNAGFTGNHELFGYPIIPKAGAEPPQTEAATPQFKLPQGVTQDPKTIIDPQNANTILVTIQTENALGLLWNIDSTGLSWIQEGRNYKVEFPHLATWKIFAANATLYSIRIVLTRK